MFSFLTTWCLPLVVASSLLTAGCSLISRSAKLPEPIGVIAVMPIERAEPASATPPTERPQLEPNAERVVTAQIYGVLSASPAWRFVPDLAVADALSRQGSSSGDRAARARTLGKAAGADSVIFGTVSRFRERVGSEYGAKQPAAVSFTLQFVSVASGNVLWTGSFEQAQQPLSSNLFNWWQFWRGGPRWFTAQEFTRLGVERLLEELSKKVGQ